MLNIFHFIFTFFALSRIGEIYKDMLNAMHIILNTF